MRKIRSAFGAHFSRQKQVWVFMILPILMSLAVLIYPAANTFARLPLGNGPNDKVDLFFMGDSYTAFNAQTGAPSGSCRFLIFAFFVYQIPEANCILGIYTLTYPFAGLSPEGLVRDRLNARGIPYEKVVKHENAVSGSTLAQWAAGVPSDLDPDNPGNLWGALAAGVKNPSTGKPIVWLTLGGNDILAYGVSYDIDNTAGWNDVYTWLKNDMDKIVRYLRAINPDVEIVIPSYTNFKINDGSPIEYPPLTSALGFCREFFGGNSNGAGFYATTWKDYNTEAYNYSVQQTNIAIQDFIYAYINANLWRTQVPTWFIGYISYAGLVNEATAAGEGQRGNIMGTYYGQFGQAWLNTDVKIRAWNRATEQSYNPKMQIMDTINKEMQAAYPENVRYIPVWTTISNEASQTIDKYASPPRTYYSDCLHLNVAGANRYIDRILNDWLPQSKYLSTR